MKAIVVHPGDPDPELRWEEAPDPAVKPGEVLVEVAAAAVNRADLLQARGQYPPPPGASEILGLEMAGTVIDPGDNASGWTAGDRVCGLLTGGGYAEKVAVPSELLLRLPDDWTMERGAALMEVWLTAYSNLFREGGLKEGEIVLLHGGASGVGTAAIQLAKAAGARVVVTAGSPEKLDRCRELGAERTIAYREEDFAEAVRKTTDGRGVDLILDVVGADYLERNLASLAENGRMVTIGLLGGAKAEINLGMILGKSLTLKGTRLRARPRSEKADIVAGFVEEFWPRLLSGRMTPVVDRVFPIQEAGAAHAYVKANRNVGKVVLRVGG
ncbi:MAG: NAD(P)H-quinone oxidoreductase [Desulfococcaceae bacterium]